jgi:hypothetical protein
MPNVEVTAINVETNFARSANTDGEGHYLIQFLPVGTYKVEARASGFKTFSQTGVVIDVASRARIDAILQMGTATENVVVHADAALVNTTDAQISTRCRTRRSRRCLWSTATSTGCWTYPLEWK